MQKPLGCQSLDQGFVKSAKKSDSEKYNLYKMTCKLQKCVEGLLVLW